MYTDGQIITKAEYTKCANWINANGNQFMIMPIGQDMYRVDLIRIPEPTEYEKAQARIAELKQMLADVDYWTSKRMDGEYTDEEWAEKVAIRKAWRAEINELELIVDKN